MFTVIVGCSATGYHLAKRLLVEGNEIVIVEKSLPRCQMMWDEMGSVIIQGDGSDPADLRRAGAARADTVVAVTGRDETNLVVCQIAKHVFSISRTVAAIKDHKNQSIFRVLGVDAVVNVSDLILNSLERSVAGNNLIRLTSLRDPTKSLVSVIVPPGSQAVGKRISRVVNKQELKESSVSLVLRGNAALHPTEELELEVDDEVIAIASADEEQSLYEMLTGA